jgi:hypothetical protein
VLPNVELIRVNDGTAGALHQPCLRKTPDPLIGYASSSSKGNDIATDATSIGGGGINGAGIPAP